MTTQRAPLRTSLRDALRDAVGVVRGGGPERRWARVAVVLAAAAAGCQLMAHGTRGPWSTWMSDMALAMAPLAAAAACFGARRVAPPEARTPWLLIGAGSALAALGHAASSGAVLRGVFPSFPSQEFLLVVLFHLAFAGGAVRALRPAREPRLAVEIALDGSLLLLAVSSLVLRLVLDQPLAEGWLAVPQAVTMLVGQFAVASSLLFAALLVFWRDTALAGAVVDGLLMAAVFLAFGHVFVVFGLDPLPDTDGRELEWIRLGGWAVLSITAILGMLRPEPSPLGRPREVAARRFRQSVIPAAALYLAGWGVAVAAADDVSGASRVVAACMGVVLALRVGAALYAVERESEDRRRAEQQVARVRLRAVTAQMSPHFLFNALHSLSALVRRDADASERALDRLGALLRYGLDAEDHAVSFRREWAFARDYLDLEALRLGARLQVVEEVDEDVLDLAVPPFVVQPLVENAVRYGVSPFLHGGRVTVRAWRAGPSLHVEVRDSGPGADPAVVADAPGVGLRGVRAQLATHFGEDWRMETRRDDDGFVVRLIMPADEE